MSKKRDRSSSNSSTTSLPNDINEIIQRPIQYTAESMRDSKSKLLYCDQLLTEINQQLNELKQKCRTHDPHECIYEAKAINRNYKKLLEVEKHIGVSYTKSSTISSNKYFNIAQDIIKTDKEHKRYKMGINITHDDIPHETIKYEVPNDELERIEQPNAFETYNNEVLPLIVHILGQLEDSPNNCRTILSRNRHALNALWRGIYHNLSPQELHVIGHSIPFGRLKQLYYRHLGVSIMNFD